MPKKPPALVQEIRDTIRKSGLRCTMARVHVLERLYAAKTPQSHADLAAELSPLGFDKATIYRNLVELAVYGIASLYEKFEAEPKKDDPNAVPTTPETPEPKTPGPGETDPKATNPTRPIDPKATDPKAPAEVPTPPKK